MVAQGRRLLWQAVVGAGLLYQSRLGRSCPWWLFVDSVVPRSYACSTGSMSYNSPQWDRDLVGLMLLPPFQVLIRYPDRGRRQVFTKCYIDASLGPVDGTSLESVSFIAIPYFFPTHPRLSIVILLQFYAIGMGFSLRRGTRTLPV